MIVVTCVISWPKNSFNQVPYQIQTKTTRNIVDVDDACRITQYTIEENELGVIHNCSPPMSFEVVEIVRQLEAVLGIKSMHSEIPGEPVTYETSKIVMQAMKNGRRSFTSDYLVDTLFKYYSDFSLCGTDIH